MNKLERALIDLKHYNNDIMKQTASIHYSQNSFVGKSAW